MSDHTEAYTQIPLSAFHSSAYTIVIQTDDTDEFIELIANYHRFGTKQVLMKQKSGKDYKITDIGEVARGL